MIELAVRNSQCAPRFRKTLVTICGTCGERPKDCRCAEEQEEVKQKELQALQRENFPKEGQ